MLAFSPIVTRGVLVRLMVIAVDEQFFVIFSSLVFNSIGTIELIVDASVLFIGPFLMV
jgi:hypothetical protein